MNEDKSFHLNASDNGVVKSSVSNFSKHGTPTISLDILGKSGNLILDAGFNVSIIQSGLSRGDVTVTTRVTGEVLNIKGQNPASLVVNRRVFRHAFLVCSLPTDTVGLPGTDLMEREGVVIDFKCIKISHSGISEVNQVVSVPPTLHMALTIYSAGKAGRSPQLNQREARRINEQSSASPHPENTTQQNKSWFVRATENVTVVHRCR